MKRRRLLLLAFAVMTALSLIAQSNTNTAISIQTLLREKHDAIQWGPPATNGMQIGLAMFRDGAHAAKKFDTFTYLYATNLCYGLRYPPFGYGLVLTLRDVDGNNVDLTSSGKDRTKQVSAQMQRGILRHGKSEFVPPNTPLNYGTPFNLMDCFNIKKAGTNTLLVGLTIYKLDPKGDLFAIVIPPVSMEVVFTQADLDQSNSKKE